MKGKEKIAWLESTRTGKRLIDMLKAKKSGSENTIKLAARSLYEFCEYKNNWNPDEIFENYVNLVKKDEEEGLEQIDVELTLFSIG